MSQLYLQCSTTGITPAEILYMIVSMGSASDMELFNQSEIGDVDINGYPEFLDGWGNKIMFLRWAPGFSSESDIQTGDPVNDHDPFDPLKLELAAFNLIPLIYSAGPDKEYGIRVENPSGSTFQYNGNPYQNTTAGDPIGMPMGTSHYDNIHNHRIEAR